MIDVREISKSFGRVRAVRDLSLSLPAGQIAGLLGPNGAGKTTTIRMITGYLPPDTGRVIVAGHDLRRSPGAARRSIGYLPESAPLYPEMSAPDYLRYRARLYGLRGRQRRAAVEHVLDRCRLRDMRRRRIGHMSKGYKQRVGLAAALLHDPRVLILDEPTNGLDPTQIRETRSLIRELAEDRTMLVSSHILPEIERTCDRVIIMAAGRVCADGAPRELVGGLRGAAAYTVEVRSNPRAGAAWSLDRLRRIPGVASASLAERQPEDAGAGWARVRISAAPDAPDLREAIAGAAADEGLFVRELGRETPTLEDLFMRLVVEGAEGQAA